GDAILVDSEEVQPVGPGIPYTAKYIVFTPTTADGDLTFSTSPEGDHTLLLDNIRIMKGAVVAPVSLSISFDGSNVKISWSVDATDYKLESTTSLPGGWAADNSTVTVDGNQNVVTVPIAGAAKFYRLKK